jgi:hypothetical protein
MVCDRQRKAAAAMREDWNQTRFNASALVFLLYLRKAAPLTRFMLLTSTSTFHFLET